jgi:hypothetical protein
MQLPPPFHPHRDGEVNAITATGSGQASIVGVLTSSGPPTSLDEVGRRLNELTAAISRVDQGSRTSIDRLRADLGLGLEAQAKKHDEDVRRVATEGVRLGLLGLSLVIVGTIGQMVAVIIG